MYRSTCVCKNAHKGIEAPPFGHCPQTKGLAKDQSGARTRSTVDVWRWHSSLIGPGFCPTHGRSQMPFPAGPIPPGPVARRHPAAAQGGGHHPGLPRAEDDLPDPEGPRPRRQSPGVPRAAVRQPEVARDAGSTRPVWGFGWVGS